MFAMRRRVGGDLEPLLLCQICRKPLSLKDAWIGFRPVTADRPQSDEMWLHRDCLNGQAAETTFGVKRVVLWHGKDVLYRPNPATTSAVFVTFGERGP